MAKTKVEKASADEAPEMILNYLRKANRPYSAIDVSANLHNKVSKAAAVKYLEDMAERKEITRCTSGKALVYHIPQDSTDIPTPESLAAISAQTSLIRSETVALAAEAKKLRAQLATLSNTLSTADLRMAVAGLETEKAELEGRLEGLKALREGEAGGEGKRMGTSVADMQKEKVKVEADLKVWIVIEGRRRKIEKAMWDMMENARPPGMSVADYKEKLGIEE